MALQITTTSFVSSQQTRYKQPSSSSSAEATKKLSTYGGYSFGSKTYGGSQAYTTETSQQQLYNKYSNKLEAYKPSPDEFKRSVFKHTILRTSVDQQQQQQQQNQQFNTYNTTPQPAKHGWSLLSWRG